MITNFPLATQSYQATSGLASSERLVNVYVEKNPETSPFPFSLYGTAGLTIWKNLNLFSPIYGMEVMGEYLFIVAGSDVYRLDISGNMVSIGSMPVAPDRVMMTNNGTQITILTSGGQAYYCTATAGSLTKITDGDYNLSDSVTNLDGYTIFSKKSDRRFQISALNNTSSYAALDFATAERNGEKIIRSIAYNAELWHFKESIIEIYYNSGNPTFPFERKTSAAIQKGCLAKYSIATEDGSFFFIGNDNIIYQTQGYQLKPISTPAISESLDSYEVISDAFGFTYTSKGHSFYCLTFPSENKTWEYDISTEVWHERQSGQDRWRANCQAFFTGKNLVGDSITGLIYEIDPNSYTENGNTIIRKIVSTTQFANFKKASLDALILIMDTGVGIDGSGQGTSPQIMARFSFDGGKTWGEEMWQPLGEIGRYDTEVYWTSAGYGRSCIIELTMSDPVKFAILSSYLSTTLGSEF